jgi:integrase
MPQGGPLDYNRFRSRYWNPAVNASVGQPCTPHDLRHIHVAMLIARGESPKYIADRLEQAKNASRADQARTKRGPEVIELPARTPKSLGR